MDHQYWQLLELSQNDFEQYNEQVYEHILGQCWLEGFELFLKLP